MKTTQIEHECHACSNAVTDDLLGYSEYEEVLKALDAAVRTAKHASHLAVTLESKINFQRLEKVCQESRRQLRLQLFEYENAAKECGIPDNQGAKQQVKAAMERIIANKRAFEGWTCGHEFCESCISPVKQIEQAMYWLD